MNETASAATPAGEYYSFCRICSAGCGTRLTVDDAGKIVRIVGDDQSELSAGYMCFKGLQSPAALNDPSRLLNPLKREKDGRYIQIRLEQALDEIAERLDAILAQSGPNAIGLYAGSGSIMGVTNTAMNKGFLEALGSDQYYTPVTIDQSGKRVAAGRMGSWAAGAVDLDQMDVLLLVGANPLVSHSTFAVLGVDPVKRLKRARQRGMKLIVIDPRKTETAAQADMAYHPLPGEDAAIAAGLIRLILDEGWHDAEFCAEHVGADRMANLRKAVEPFTPGVAEKRAGLEPGSLYKIADLFARQCSTGQALTGTGTNMAQFSNVAVHMVQLLNVICGRFPRAGQRIDYVDVLSPPVEAYAEVLPPSRAWEKHPPSRIRGVSNFFGERVTGTLSDEILTPGEGQLRALIVDGANPMTALPDRAKALAAMRALDLLVVIDAFDTGTTREADYILPAKLQYERCDLSPNLPPLKFFPGAWAQFTPAIVSPPEGSEVVDDWYVFWALAKRLGLAIRFCGQTLEIEGNAPSIEELLNIYLANSHTSLEELRQYPHGRQFPIAEAYVQPRRPDRNDARFDVMPDDVLAELGQYAAAPPSTARAGAGGEFTHLLVSRRQRDIMNSMGTQLQSVRKRNKYNPACLNGRGLRDLGMEPGQRVEIVSAHGRTQAFLGLDDTLRDGVVSLSHGWGGAEDNDPLVHGTSVNSLIDTDRNFESINAMPHMSAVPIRISPLSDGPGPKDARLV